MIKRKSLIWVTVICLFLSLIGATLGLSKISSNSQISYADATVFDASKAVSVEGATVTAGADKSGGETHKGLLVAPETALGSYSGNLNAVLPANSTITYTFPGSLNSNWSSMWIDFTFRFTSLKTGEWFEVYTVMINGNWWNSLMVRDMEGHTRTTNRWGGNKWWDVKLDNGDMYPQYGGSDLPSGYFKTVYADGVFSLDVPSKENPNVTLAKFDCDEYTAIPSGETSINGSLCGLKKIDFSEGYTLSFAANACNGYATAPLLIESINDQSFESASFEAEPSWYTTYATMPQITLSGEIAQYYTAAEPLIVPEATYVTLKSTTAQPVAKIELSKDGGEWTVIEAGYSVAEAGQYALKYTAIDGGTNPGNTVKKSFGVYGDYYAMKDAVTVKDAKVTAGADTSGTVLHKGLLVKGIDKYGEYSGSLNGVFKGDSKITFSFPGSLGDGSNHFARYIDFTFRFTDVNDSTNYFDVFFFNDGWNGWYNAMGVRDNNGNIRTTRYRGLTIFDTPTSGNGDNVLCNMPMYGGDNLASGYISLQWNGDVLEVHALSIDLNDYCIAKFDSDEYQKISGTTYGLKKIAFSDGYKLSFMAKSYYGEATAPLLLEEINGISLTDRFLSPEYMVLDGMEYIGGERVEVTATTDQVSGEALGAGVKFAYSVKLGSLSLNDIKYIYPDINLKQVGEKDYSYTFLGQSVEQTIAVVDTPPVLSLNGIAEEEGVRKGGPNASVYEIKKTDVNAVDLLDGLIGEGGIRIYSKAPGEAEFTEISAGLFNPVSLGIYEIKYVATDSCGLSAELVRKIRVVDGSTPVISINGTMPETALVGFEFTLPNVTATDNGQPISNLVVNVYSESDIIEVKGGKVVFNKAGTYNIVYLAIDSDGNESKLAFVVKAVADDVKPVIGQVVLPTQAKLNTRITIPGATATDNADGTISATVKVYYGTSEIDVSSGSFTADKEGVYTVVFTAKDSTGNTGERIYQIKVLKNINEDISLSTSAELAASGLSNGENTLMVVILIVVGVALAAGVVVTICILKRRNK